MSDTVWLQRPSGDIPWGFRLGGGSDLGEPLSVHRVTAGSIAATGLNKGDVVLRIGDSETAGLTNMEANECIKKCGNLLQLHVSKMGASNNYGSSPGAPPPMHQSYQPPPPQQQQQQQPAHRPNTWQPPQQPHSPVSPLSPGGSGRAPTRLEQQLSNLSMGQPLSPVHYPEEEAPKPAAPQSVAPGGPGYGQPQFVGPSSYSKKSPPSAQQTKGPAMPDAVLNMAAKGPPEKKPWAYAVDMDSIQSQRDKMNAQRKKAPPGNLPRYQHMLNMPDFSDAPVPPHVKQQPQQQQQQQQQQQEEKPMEDGMYAHAQYNSPLQMYSNENVNEAFSGQTQGEVMGVKPGDSPQGAGNAPKKDIVMSPTYRLIHGLDAEKPRPKVIPPPEARQMVRGPREDDETKFSGFHTQADIPSKSFHRLQQQVSHPDTGAPHQDSLGVDDAVGNYDETSIRYRGRNIPSKSFRMLQNMTGGPVEQLPAEEVAVPDTQPTDQTAIATERRRRRRNQSGGDQLEEAPKNPDFDEKAYLSGRVQIVSGSVNNPHAAAPFEKASSSTPAPEWKKDKTPEREFDESAFLAGRYATINDEATPIPARGHNGVHNAESPEQEKHFDENAFLQGKIPVLSDEPKEFAPRARPQREMAPWELRRKEEEEEEARRQAEFDEQAFLSGRIPLVRGDSHDPTPLAKVAYTHKPKKRVQEEEERPQIENYDEDAFLSGKISILGGDNNPALPPRQPRKKPEKELASWQKRRQNAHVPLENGDAQQVEHGDGPVKSAPKKKVHRERAPWERPNEEDDFDSACSSDAEFDEHAFLRGRVPTVRSSQEREMSGSEGGFDQIPSRKFTMLRRSVSRDRSPSRESDTSDYSSYRDGNEGGDPDRVIKKLTYKGGAIPSKTFMKLQRRVNRGAVPPSPSPQPSTADQGLDVDQAMDKMSMENKDPNEYFDQLKKSMQEQDVKIEPEEEITDF